MPTPTPINSHSAATCCSIIAQHADDTRETRTAEDLLADDTTCVMSNTTSDRGWAAQAAHGEDLRGWDDDMTAATEPETEDSDSDAETGRHLTRIPHMVLPWGGPTASKATRKWKNRMKKRDE